MKVKNIFLVIAISVLSHAVLITKVPLRVFIHLRRQV